MALPEKNYFYLQEVIQRWKISEMDLRYYAENDLIKIEAWLPDVIAKIYTNKRTEDGELAKIYTGVRNYKGYAIIDPSEIRKAFSKIPQFIEWFKNPRNNEDIKLMGLPEKITLQTDDFIILKSEIERFETKHGTSSKLKNIPSFAGRPSVMGSVIKEFERRCSESEVEETLSAEGKYLAKWAQENIDSPQTPKQRTIMNAIRTSYNKKKKPV